MKLIKQDQHSAEIQFTIDELEMLINALNEVCHGIDIEEFETRLGVSQKKMEQLLRHLNKILSSSLN